ncbi:acyloxyacyl hydrolase [uncultured Alistipes sp.]|uniref:acyloxyacyl hydrolase n=1 Tax=uncultured Alistipes sp. TaxID=538949 RepID=UPI0025D88072|nr:acyloxyacyl hydrolase [uncultured Alistipes sp.]
MKLMLYYKICCLCVACAFLLPGAAAAAGTDSLAVSTVQETSASLPGKRIMHSVGIGIRPEYILPTNDFVRGDNYARKSIAGAISAHLRYSFGFAPGTVREQMYSGVYQGIGAAYYSLQNKKEVGAPAVIYLFQGARIAQINPRASFNYEWNLGLSYGLEPFDDYSNPYNDMIGSKLNIYLHAGVYFNWMVAPRLDFRAGIAFSHFSSGNTHLPNKGMNILGLQLGLQYNFGRTDNPAGVQYRSARPAFMRHFSYDLVLFGGWRPQGVEIGDDDFYSPHSYGLGGFNFEAMYNFNRLFRLGASLDAVYNGSANVYAIENPVSTGGYSFRSPPLAEQITVGLSVRAELVMPYFTLGVGSGVNFVHKGRGQERFYQLLTLKVAVTRSSFLYLGYCLQNFETPNPNYLMLGAGFRFNNKYPVLR